MVAPSNVRPLITVRITTPHERADGVAHVCVVAAQPVDPADHERVAGPEQIEEPVTFWTIHEARMDARYALVGNDHIDPEAGCFGLFALMGDRLIGSADAGVQDRLHGIIICPLGYCPHDSLSVGQDQPERTGFRA